MVGGADSCASPEDGRTHGDTGMRVRRGSRVIDFDSSEPQRDKKGNPIAIGQPAQRVLPLAVRVLVHGLARLNIGGHLAQMPRVLVSALNDAGLLQQPPANGPTKLLVTVLILAALAPVAAMAPAHATPRSSTRPPTCSPVAC